MAAAKSNSAASGTVVEAGGVKNSNAPKPRARPELPWMMVIIIIIGLAIARYPRALARWPAWLSELKALWSMPKEQTDAYVASLGSVMIQERITGREDEDRVAAWYRVLNHFCALGAVEKMYIPPVLDPQAGVTKNQQLFEFKMSDMLGVGPGNNIIDLGCGKGRIAHEVASHTGAKVHGLNYDMDQIDQAKAFAEEAGMLGTQLDFTYGSFNDPLPYADESMDGGYEVGAFSYAIDKVKLFTEIHRVLKPGARFSYCDWCKMNYNPNDTHHVKLLRQLKPMVGMVEMPSPQEVESAFKDSGFEIEFSGEASIGGNQLSILLGDTFGSFWFAEKIVDSLNWLGVAPRHLKPTWNSMREGGQALQEAVDLQLFSMSYQIVVRKPERPPTK